ncbi:Dps DNA-binding ferritin-like protein (oxidative damage protectant) [uncultured Caudovirales phage]|uniref:Dps DNA-binding ferritin-like protein (Oxidative damage protectant) n=1 Tax=uncultured Caudovirales phage TaxID=2100421 RepID=A0A6J5NZ09_9CAUD|nr:Dps DNA-binding ferritin-like protein (oxidative damage protectant) [uncultured Caudovirales phage]
MANLVDELKVALADTFSFYLKAHNYHWNVEGANFPQYHSFFGDLYNEAWSATDVIAEGIRTLDAYAPASYTRFKDLSTIEEELKIPQPMTMVTRLLADNQKVLSSLTTAYKTAEAEGKLGISNMLQDRIQAHEKHGWMLKSISKA